MGSRSHNSSSSQYREYRGTYHTPFHFFALSGYVHVCICQVQALTGKAAEVYKDVSPGLREAERFVARVTQGEVSGRVAERSKALV